MSEDNNTVTMQMMERRYHCKVLMRHVAAQDALLITFSPPSSYAFTVAVKIREVDDQRSVAEFYALIDARLKVEAHDYWQTLQAQNLEAEAHLYLEQAKQEMTEAYE